MIDLDYDSESPLVQTFQNIVKNYTIIYCVQGQYCSSCVEALDPIRIVTTNNTEACQQASTNSGTPSFVSVHFSTLLFPVVNFILLLIIV